MKKFLLIAIFTYLAITINCRIGYGQLSVRQPDAVFEQIMTDLVEGGGGACYFNVLYDIESREFSRLRIDGITVRSSDPEESERLPEKQ